MRRPWRSPTAADGRSRGAAPRSAPPSRTWSCRSTSTPARCCSAPPLTASAPPRLLIGACAAALREFPRVNGAYRDGRYELYSRVNVGVVIQTPDTQVAATILDADAKSPAELDDELARLTARARSGELTPPEQAGATFTFSDLGEYGIHRAAGLVIPSQAATLTAGAIRAVPVVRDGAVTPGHVLTLTLASDHRIVFGIHATGFLGRVAELAQT